MVYAIRKRKVERSLRGTQDYVWGREVSQIAGPSKGKREENPVSTVALDHVCVHV